MSNNAKKTKHAKANAPLKPTWAQEPAPHDYPAAGSYLNLLALHPATDILTTLLAQEPTVHQFAKDILRASTLPLLPMTDPQVMRDLAKLRDGLRWSPILLIRGDLTTGRPLTIADGYHRVCASYHLGENTPIPCRIASVPTVGL